MPWIRDVRGRCVELTTTIETRNCAQPHIPIQNDSQSAIFSELCFVGPMAVKSYVFVRRLYRFGILSVFVLGLCLLV